ncbi:MAG: acyl--CoA ligase, partial [Actinomycetales bacterium]|nr:acyl--CoA ligase [Actinomycetales bacterium]
MSAFFATNEAVLSTAERFATGLAQVGLTAGARILVTVDQKWESVALMWACLGLELVPIPVSPNLTETELASIRLDLDPALELLSWDEQEGLAMSVRTPIQRVPHCRPIHLTSGTTGRPKGVWSRWWTPELAQSALAEEVELWGFTDMDINLVVSPLYHSAPLRFALNTVISGGDLLVPPRFKTGEIAALVREHSPTTMFCVPTHLKRLLNDLPEADLRAFASFRLVVHAGAPCPAELKARAIGQFGRNVLAEFYGSTEGQFTVCHSTDWLERRSGVGIARTNRTMFVDESQQLWCIVPPWATFEYFGDPERSAMAWQQTENGPAFTVGDLGRIDPDGWVHIDARRTDLIISGGVNLYPREIEAVLERHPDVTDCAVVGRDHPDWGQESVAIVVGATNAIELTT